MRWSEMQPRERDAWLAEKACGWTRIFEDDFGDGADDNEWLGYPEGVIPTVLTAPTSIPHYTTDPAAALALAEAMRGKEYTVILFLWAGWEPAERRYSAEIANSDYAMANGKADSLPSAVSLAAFRALGGEE